MTSHLDSHMPTDVKRDMLSGVQTGNGIPHDKYNIRGIVHTLTNRKDDIFMLRQLYVDEAHTALDIPLEILIFRSAIYRRCDHFSIIKLLPYLMSFFNIQVLSIVFNLSIALL